MARFKTIYLGTLSVAVLGLFFLSSGGNALASDVNIGSGGTISVVDMDETDTETHSFNSSGYDADYQFYNMGFSVSARDYGTGYIKISGCFTQTLSFSDGNVSCPSSNYYDGNYDNNDAAVYAFLLNGSYALHPSNLQDYNYFTFVVTVNEAGVNILGHTRSVRKVSIDSFTTSSAMVNAGDTFTVSWNTDQAVNGVHLYWSGPAGIDSGDQGVSADGNWTFTATSAGTATFILCAYGMGHNGSTSVCTNGDVWARDGLNIPHADAGTPGNVVVTINSSMPAPGGFSLNNASCPSGTSYTLSWGASSGATSYDVYRHSWSYSNISEFVLEASGITGTSYNAGSPSGEDRYWYIKARNAGGETNANIIGVTCPAAAYSWYTGAWSSCLPSCGPGTQTRVVQCRYTDPGTGVVEVASNEAGCLALSPRPPASQACNDGACSIIPSADINCNPGSIPYAGSSTITWSSNNVSSCTVTRNGVATGWSGLSGTQSTGGLSNGSYTYTVICNPF